MHLDEEQVQRLLHGELGAPAEASSRDHVATCPECRSRLEEAEREEEWVLDRLGRLDHPQPTVGVESVMNARVRRTPAWGRLAAGIFLALAAAGVAYAAPGSPLPRAIERLIQLIGGSREQQRTPAAAPSAGKSQAGIAIAPGDRLTIVFLGDQSGNTAVVSLTDSSDIVVRALGGTTTFTSDPDRLSIAHQGAPAGFEIQIPRAARSVEIRVGGRRIFLKELSRISTDLRPDARGSYRIALGAEP